VKDATSAKGTLDRPSGTCRLSADDPVQIQEMNCHRLNGLRGVVPVMLHAIRITVEGVQGESIVVCWNGHEVVGNPRLHEQTSIVSAFDQDRTIEQRPAPRGCTDVTMRRSVVWWEQGTTTRAGRELANRHSRGNPRTYGLLPARSLAAVAQSSTTAK
jgi:hypothetical protein